MGEGIKMSNKQNDIIAEQQAEQEIDRKIMLLELEKELATKLTMFYIGYSEKTIKLSEAMEQIINLFRKYKEAI